VLEESDPAAELARLGGRGRRAIEQNLAAGETVRVVIRGTAQQAIVGTEQRALVVKPGFMPGAEPGAEVTAWNYRDLLGIEVNERVLGGSVVLQVPGHVDIELSFWGGGSGGPRTATNAIPISGDWKLIHARAATLRSLIEAAHPIDDIHHRLADLLREGVLSHQEFGAAEQRLFERQATHH
jgi:hypothetical protein